MTTLQIVGWAIFALSFLNTIFVWDAIRRYFRTHRHPIMLVPLVVKVTLWLVGLPFGIIAGRVAVGLPALPLGGILLAWGILGILLLPAFIWTVLRRYET